MSSFEVFKLCFVGNLFMQETSGAYARMSFDLEEVRSLMLNSVQWWLTDYIFHICTISTVLEGDIGNTFDKKNYGIFSQI